MGYSKMKELKKKLLETKIGNVGGLRGRRSQRGKVVGHFKGRALNGGSNMPERNCKEKGLHYGRRKSGTFGQGRSFARGKKLRGRPKKKRRGKREDNTSKKRFSRDHTQPGVKGTFSTIRKRKIRKKLTERRLVQPSTEI